MMEKLLQYPDLVLRVVELSEIDDIKVLLEIPVRRHPHVSPMSTMPLLTCSGIRIMD